MSDIIQDKQDYKINYFSKRIAVYKESETKKHNYVCVIMMDNITTRGRKNSQLIKRQRNS